MRILIVDDDSNIEDIKNSRAYVLALLFYELRATVFLKDSEILCRAPKWQQAAHQPEELDIILLHNNNVELLGSIGEGRTIIRYGAGMIENNINGNLWIQRQIVTGYEIRKDDAIELMDWVESGMPENKTPSLLLPPRIIDYLPALAILCQGYLASHFPAPEKSSGSIKKALDKIGWSSDFIKSDSGKRIAKNVAIRADETERSEWWKEIFGAKDLSAKIENEIRKEIPEFINKLINIFGSDKPISEPELVANAYLEIDDLLRDTNVNNKVGNSS